MKKLVLAVALAVGMVGVADAATWFVGGVMYGNVCRNGAYYTVYPIRMGQPVGSSCPVRDGYNNIIGYGVVTAE